MDNIEKTFYEEIIPEAATGRVNAERPYNIGFNTSIWRDNEEYFIGDNDLFPTLMIKNIKIFNDELVDYVNTAKTFYDKSLYEEPKYEDKIISSLLWGNATETDFNNPELFMKRTKDFIKDTTMDHYKDSKVLGYSPILDGNIIVKLEKEKVYFESPYRLKITVENGSNIYEFPLVRFGISNSVGYIYAVQNKQKETLSSYEKKINRALYKVNENFVEPSDGTDNIDNPENLTGIAPSTLVSLTVMFALLNKHGVNDVLVPDFLPVRYNSKKKAYQLKAEHLVLRQGIPLEEANALLEIEQERITRNITDKFIRHLRRLEYHFSNIKVNTLPGEVSEYTHLIVNNEYGCNNQLLDEVFKLSNDNINKKTF